MQRATFHLCMSFAILLVLAFPACGSKKSPQPVTPKSSSNTPPPQPEKDYKSMVREISQNGVLTDKALDLLDQAEDLRKQGQAATGAEQKALLQNAKNLYVEAGDIYDQLREAADKKDPKLWGHYQGFNTFSGKYDGKAKRLTRLGF